MATTTTTDDATNVTDPLDRLRERCVVMTYRVSWIPSSVQLDRFHKDQMVGALTKAREGEAAAEADVANDAMSVSKKLFSSKHDTIKALNASREALDAVRKSYTIPVAEPGSVQPGEGEQRRAAAKIAASIRLILRDKVEEFDRVFAERVADLKAAARKVDEAMPEILAEEKKRLGRTFKADDYPASVAASVRVQGPFYTEFSIPVKLPAHVIERQAAHIRDQFTATMGVAADHLVSEMSEEFIRLANQLGYRRRVGPSPAKEYEAYANCEFAIEKPLTDGRYQVDVRTEKIDNGTGRDRLVIDRLIFDSREEYERALQPQIVPGAKGIIQARSVDTVLNWVNDFSRLKDLLGDHGQALDEKLQAIRKAVVGLSGASNPAERLRTSTSRRETLATALREAVNGLAEASETRIVRTGVRRLAVG